MDKFEQQKYVSDSGKRRNSNLVACIPARRVDVFSDRRMSFDDLQYSTDEHFQWVRRFSRELTIGESYMQGETVYAQQAVRRMSRELVHRKLDTQVIFIITTITQYIYENNGLCFT